MKVYGDYHTHTYYSDGYSSVEENVNAALEKGLKELAITDHGYANPSKYALTREKFKAQRIEIEREREKHGDKISLLQGVEADIISVDGEVDLLPSDIEDMDIIIMGYHSFSSPKSPKDRREIFYRTYLAPVIPPSKERIRKNTKMMIKALKRYPIDILSHINHLFKVDCYELSKAASDYGTYIELNSKHFNFSHDIFEKMLTTKANFILNSDAHRHFRIAQYDKIEEFLKEHSFDRSRIVNLDGNRPEFKNR